MACGWLEMPFWTFFGATLLGKGVVKVTLQSLVCIVVFGQGLWQALLRFTPALTLPASMCKSAGAAGAESCLLKTFLEAGRFKMMHKFSMQRRMLLSELLDGKESIDIATLTDRYCKVRAPRRPPPPAPTHPTPAAASPPLPPLLRPPRAPPGRAAA